MSEEYSKLSLIKRTCPTCGAPITYTAEDSSVVCMCCGNQYSVVKEKFVDKDGSQVKGGSSTVDAEGKIRIDGIKTSSSALAYIEQFLDTYDWDSFAYDDDFIIDELEEVVNNLKVTSADDYKTWIAAIMTLAVPFQKKIEYRQRIFENIIEEFRKNNQDAYGMYDGYKKVSKSLMSSYDSVKTTLEKYLGYAKKYDVPSSEYITLEKLVKSIDISELSNSVSYDSLKDVPEIQKIIKEQREALVEHLKDKGILDPEQEYQNALKLIEENKYVEALDILYALETYNDADKLAAKINRHFKVSETFINQDKIYYLSKNGSTSSLHRVVNNKIEKEALVKNISKIITNYADTIYYFDNDNKIRSYNLTSGESTCSSASYNPDKLHLVKERGKFYFEPTTENNVKRLNVLDCHTKKIKKLIEGLRSIIAFTNDYALCTRLVKIKEKDYLRTVIYRLETGEFNVLTKETIVDKVFFENKLVYTVESPSDKNKDLYLYNIDTRENVLIEKNVVGKLNFADGRIYYYTKDNLDYKYLISINVDGEDRRELGPYISSVLFKIGDWLYFVKSFRHNSALCKMRFDGRDMKIIAFGIKTYVKMENGLIYYLDYGNNLHRVRNDGSRDIILCQQIISIVKSSENKIVFEAQDGLYRHSLYAIDYNQSGHRKAAFDVRNSKQYDDDFVYYIKQTTSVRKDDQGNSSVVSGRRALYRININTYEEEKLVTLSAPPIEAKSSLMALSSVFSWLFGIIWVIVLIIIAATGNAAPIEECSGYGYCVIHSSGVGIFLVVFFIIVRIVILIVRQALLKKKAAKKVVGLLTLIFASIIGGVVTLLIPDKEYKD